MQGLTQPQPAQHSTPLETHAIQPPNASRALHCRCVTDRLCAVLSGPLCAVPHLWILH